METCRFLKLFAAIILSLAGSEVLAATCNVGDSIKILESVFYLRYPVGMHKAFPWVSDMVDLKCPELERRGFNRASLHVLDQLTDITEANQAARHIKDGAEYGSITTSDIEAAKEVFRRSGINIKSVPLQHFMDEIEVKLREAQRIYGSERTCGTVEASTTFLPTPGYMPRGYCYAEGAADIISDFLKLPISSTALGLAYNFSRFTRGEIAESQITKVEGGFTHLAASAAKPPFLCSDKDFPNKYFTFESGKPMHTLEIVEGLLQANAGLSEGQIKIAFPSFNFDKYSSAQKPMHLIDLMPLICRDQIPIPPQPISDWPPNAQAKYEIIDKALSEGRPVAISFLFSFYFYDRMPDRMTFKPTGVGHGATVVGRKFNKTTKQCDYLIRDVFVEEAPRNPMWRTDGKHIVVSREALVKHVSSIHYFGNASGRK